MRPIVRHVGLPALAPAAIVALYFTPVQTFGCVVRGLMVYVYPSAAEASIYALMALILLVRPRGLFGERILRFE